MVILKTSRFKLSKFHVADTVQSTTGYAIIATGDLPGTTLCWAVASSFDQSVTCAVVTSLTAGDSVYMKSQIVAGHAQITYHGCAHPCTTRVFLS